MHAAILGGSGLIGSATAARLAALGLRVTVLSRRRPAQLCSGSVWREAELTDAGGLRAVLGELHVDAVVHLAAFLQFACEQDPAQAVRVNIDGTLHVLDACRSLGIRRVVFGSSIAAYGERHDVMREDDPPSASIGIYGMTKRIGEMLGERYAALHGLEFVALRYTGVIGPGEVHSPGMALVRQRIRECARGADVAIEGASGEEHVHLTHVADAAEATRLALVHPRPRHYVYNVAGPAANYMSLREFHATLRELVPSAGAALWSGRGPGSGPVDTARLRDDLGFTPAVGVAAGLAADLGLGPPLTARGIPRDN